MFHLIPKKLRDRGGVAVRQDERAVQESDYHPLARLREEFDALMDRYFEEKTWFPSSAAGVPGLWESQPGWSLDQSLHDNEKEYVFRVELPGFEPDEFDVSVRGKALSLRAEHKEKKEEDGGSRYRYGSFVRTFTLPQGVDENNIEACYRSGILEVHMPKTDQARGKRIEVKSK